MFARFNPLFLLLVTANLGCGDDGGRDGPGGPLPSCEDYCERLRTSEGGCAGEVESCPTDCDLWVRENADAGCEDLFDDLLDCTDGTDEVCTAIRNECSVEWSAWADCIDSCDIPSVGDVTFSPICPPTEPCASGTELTMLYAGQLNCSALATLTCAGASTNGFFSPSDTTATGTITLACSDPSGCGLQTHTAFLESSGGATVVSCTP